MVRNDPRLAELTGLIESIVAQVLNKSFGEHMTTWAVNNPRTSVYLSHETGDRDSGVNPAQLFDGLADMTSLIKMIKVANLESFLKKNKIDINKIDINKIDKNIQDKIMGTSSQLESLNKITNTLGGLAGVFGAYQSGDAIGGAMSGYQLGKGLGFGHPLIGAAIGLLAGLFSPGIDKWYRPKFKTAKQAFDKLFTMDRGERDDYYMPDSFYFRTGWQGPKKIVVKVGNNQFDDHIRESLTNAYESQLQRGLVF